MSNCRCEWTMSVGSTCTYSTLFAPNYSDEVEETVSAIFGYLFEWKTFISVVVLILLLQSHFESVKLHCIFTIWKSQVTDKCISNNNNNYTNNNKHTLNRVVMPFPVCSLSESHSRKSSRTNCFFHRRYYNICLSHMIYGEWTYSNILDEMNHLRAPTAT